MSRDTLLTGAGAGAAVGAMLTAAAAYAVADVDTLPAEEQINETKSLQIKTTTEIEVVWNLYLSIAVRMLALTIDGVDQDEPAEKVFPFLSVEVPRPNAASPDKVRYLQKAREAAHSKSSDDKHGKMASLALALIIGRRAMRGSRARQALSTTRSILAVSSVECFDDVTVDTGKHEDVAQSILQHYIKVRRSKIGHKTSTTKGARTGELTKEPNPVIVAILWHLFSQITNNMYWDDSTTSLIRKKALIQCLIDFVTNILDHPTLNERTLKGLARPWLQTLKVELGKFQLELAAMVKTLDQDIVHGVYERATGTMIALKTEYQSIINNRAHAWHAWTHIISPASTVQLNTSLGKLLKIANKKFMERGDRKITSDDVATVFNVTSSRKTFWGRRKAAFLNSIKGKNGLDFPLRKFFYNDRDEFVWNSYSWTVQQLVLRKLLEQGEIPFDLLAFWNVSEQYTKTQILVEALLYASDFMKEEVAQFEGQKKTRNDIFTLQGGSATEDDLVRLGEHYSLQKGIPQKSQQENISQIQRWRLCLSHLEDQVEKEDDVLLQAIESLPSIDSAKFTTPAGEKLLELRGVTSFDGEALQTSISDYHRLVLLVDDLLGKIKHISDAIELVCAITQEVGKAAALGVIMVAPLKELQTISDNIFEELTNAMTELDKHRRNTAIGGYLSDHLSQPVAARLRRALGNWLDRDIAEGETESSLQMTRRTLKMKIAESRRTISRELKALNSVTGSECVQDAVDNVKVKMKQLFQLMEERLHWQPSQQLLDNFQTFYTHWSKLVRDGLTANKFSEGGERAFTLRNGAVIKSLENYLRIACEALNYEEYDAAKLIVDYCKQRLKDHTHSHRVSSYVKNSVPVGLTFSGKEAELHSLINSAIVLLERRCIDRQSSFVVSVLSHLSEVQSKLNSKFEQSDGTAPTFSIQPPLAIVQFVSPPTLVMMEDDPAIAAAEGEIEGGRVSGASSGGISTASSTPVSRAFAASSGSEGDGGSPIGLLHVLPGALPVVAAPVHVATTAISAAPAQQRAAEQQAAREAEAARGSAAALGQAGAAAADSAATPRGDAMPSQPPSAEEEKKPAAPAQPAPPSLYKLAVHMHNEGLRRAWNRFRIIANEKGWSIDIRLTQLLYQQGLSSPDREADTVGLLEVEVKDDGAAPFKPCFIEFLKYPKADGEYYARESISKTLLSEVAEKLEITPEQHGSVVFENNRWRFHRITSIAPDQLTRIEQFEAIIAMLNCQREMRAMIFVNHDVEHNEDWFIKLKTEFDNKISSGDAIDKEMMVSRLLAYASTLRYNAILRTPKLDPVRAARFHSLFKYQQAGFNHADVASDLEALLDQDGLLQAAQDPEGNAIPGRYVLKDIAVALRPENPDEQKLLEVFAVVLQIESWAARINPRFDQELVDDTRHEDGRLANPHDGCSMLYAANQADVKLGVDMRASTCAQKRASVYAYKANLVTEYDNKVAARDSALVGHLDRVVAAAPQLFFVAEDEARAQDAVTETDDQAVAAIDNRIENFFTNLAACERSVDAANTEFKPILEHARQLAEEYYGHTGKYHDQAEALAHVDDQPSYRAAGFRKAEGLVKFATECMALKTSDHANLEAEYKNKYKAITYIGQNGSPTSLGSGRSKWYKATRVDRAVSSAVSCCSLFRLFRKGQTKTSEHMQRLFDRAPGDTPVHAEGPARLNRRRSGNG